MKSSRLGRGLDALLPVDDARSEQLRSVSLASLRPGKYQPRTRMDQSSLAQLAESIKAQGVIQPVLVRALDPGNFEIIAGERRWRAAQMAGLAEIPILVRDIPERASLAIALVENIQREDLNPLEEAQGVRRLIDEFELSHDDAAQAIGRSRSAVSNLLRLLQLAPTVQERLLRGELDMGHARALLPLSKSAQVELAQEITSRELSVREAEQLVKKRLAPAVPRARQRSLDRDVLRLAETLSDALATTVSIEPRRNGRGRIVIDYASLDALDALVRRLSTVVESG